MKDLKELHFTDVTHSFQSSQDQSLSKTHNQITLIFRCLLYCQRIIGKHRKPAVPRMFWGLTVARRREMPVLRGMMKSRRAHPQPKPHHPPPPSSLLNTPNIPSPPFEKLNL